MREEPQLPIMQEREPAYVENHGGQIGVYGKTEVTTAEWTHVARCCFGEGRPCWGFPNSNTKWTGSSHRYDIFTKERKLGGAYVAIRWRHGGGVGWIVTDDNRKRCETSLPLIIAAVPDEGQRWDACHYICDAVQDIASAEATRQRRELETAFLEGRMKKRKRNHKYSVEVTPRVERTATAE